MEKKAAKSFGYLRSTLHVIPSSGERKGGPPKNTRCSRSLRIRRRRQAVVQIEGLVHTHTKVAAQKHTRATKIIIRLLLVFHTCTV